MKTKQEISDLLDKIDPHRSSSYPSMSFENGVEEALQWVLEEHEEEKEFMEAVV